MNENEYTPGEAAEMDQRFASHSEQIDRRVWYWRVSESNHRCGPDGCDITPGTDGAASADPTKLKGEYAKRLFEEFANKPGGLVALIEELTVAIAKLSQADPARPPEHMWVAKPPLLDDTVAYCSCGWSRETSSPVEAQYKWAEHAGGDGLIVQDWQMAYLDSLR